MLNVVLAVDRDPPAALDQEQRELLGETFEPAMRGRNAARSQQQHVRLNLRHGDDLNRHNVRPAMGRIAPLPGTSQTLCPMQETPEPQASAALTTPPQRHCLAPLFVDFEAGQTLHLVRPKWRSCASFASIRVLN